MLVIDPWHWLTKDGDFVTHDQRLYRRMLRIARFIEYGEVDATTQPRFL